ncbi:MAG: BLUF domain-containing protein [Oceanococcaceae bacterium]
MNPLFRTIYMSESVEPLTGEAFAQMSEAFSRKNSLQDISGLLLVVGRYYLQIIEGPESQTRSLMQRIHDDPRHTNVLLLSEQNEDLRIFGSWAMRGLDVDRDVDLDPALRARIQGFVHETSAAASQDPAAARALVYAIAQFLRGRG